MLFVPLTSKHVVSLNFIHNFHRSKYRILFHVGWHNPGVKLAKDVVFVRRKHVLEGVGICMLVNVSQKFKGPLAVVKFVCWVWIPL